MPPEVLLKGRPFPFAEISWPSERALLFRGRFGGCVGVACRLCWALLGVRFLGGVLVWVDGLNVSEGLRMRLALDTEKPAFVGRVFGVPLPLQVSAGGSWVCLWPWVRLSTRAGGNPSTGRQVIKNPPSWAGRSCGQRAGGQRRRLPVMACAALPFAKPDMIASDAPSGKAYSRKATASGSMSASGATTPDHGTQATSPAANVAM